MRTAKRFALSFLVALGARAQSDRGPITALSWIRAGPVIAGAAVGATNTATAAVYRDGSHVSV
jgi:hypothetical protein